MSDIAPPTPPPMSPHNTPPAQTYVQAHTQTHMAVPLPLGGHTLMDKLFLQN